MDSPFSSRTTTVVTIVGAAGGLYLLYRYISTNTTVTSEAEERLTDQKKDPKPAGSSQTEAAEQASGNGNDTDDQRASPKSPVSEPPEHAAANGILTTEKPLDETALPEDSIVVPSADAAPSPPGTTLSSEDAAQGSKAPKSKGQGKKNPQTKEPIMQWWMWRETLAAGEEAVWYAGMAKMDKKKIKFDGYCKVLVNDGAQEPVAEPGSWMWEATEVDKKHLTPLEPGPAASALAIRELAEAEVHRWRTTPLALSRDVASIYISWVLQQWNSRRDRKEHGSSELRTTQIVRDVCTKMEDALRSIAHCQGEDVSGLSGAGGVLGAIRRAERIKEDLFLKVQKHVKNTRNPLMHEGAGVLLTLERAEESLKVLGALLRAFSSDAQASELDCLFVADQEAPTSDPTRALPFLEPLFTPEFQHKQDYKDNKDPIVRREWLINRLLEKLRSGEEGSPSVLLTAPAGFGKSVVMEQLCWGAGAWAEEEDGSQGIPVVAKHFCRYNRANSLDPAVFVCNLAGMLAARLPEYRIHLQSRPDMQRKFSEAQLGKEGGCSAAIETAVCEPLEELYGQDVPPSLGAAKMSLIVVDALDEAALLSSEHTILGLLRELDTYLSRRSLPWLRMVCSSRLDIFDVNEQLEDACRLVCRNWKKNSVNSEDNEHHDNIREDLQTFLELRIDGSDHLRTCLEECVDRSIDRYSSLDPTEAKEEILSSFLERAEISFRWLTFALQSMDKRGNGGTDFADTAGLPKGLGRLYLERFQKEVSVEEFQDLRPILEAMVAPLLGAPPLTTEALYDAVRFSSWRGSMQELETALETKLGGYMSKCAGVWHLDHRSVAEWLLSGAQARKYACCKLRGTAMRTAQLIWAAEVGDDEEVILRRLCGCLGLDTPQGHRASERMELDEDYLHTVLVGLHARANERRGIRGPDFKWLAGSLLSGYANKGEGTSLSLKCPYRMAVNTEDAANVGLAVAHAVAAWLEPVQTLDGARAFKSDLKSLTLDGYALRAEGCKALADSLAPREGPDGIWHYNEALSTLNLKKNKIGAEGAEALADALAPREGSDGTWHCNEALNTLKLSENKIGAEGSKALADALAPREGSDRTWHCNDALHTLNLGQNKIGAEGAKALADALAPREGSDGTWHCNKALSTLNLKINEIGEEGAKALADALAPWEGSDGTWHCNEALNTLDLSVNRIGDDVAKALADALAPREGSDGTWHCNDALHTLDLGLNEIRAEGAKALADALAPREGSDGTWHCNEALSTLNLRWNSIGSEGAKAVADALARGRGRTAAGTATRRSTP